MNKYDVEKSLKTIHETDRALTAQRRAKAQQPETASPAQRQIKPIPRRRHLLPNEFPPELHPDDWEPDDEGDRGPAVGQFPTAGSPTARRWRDDF